MLDNYTNAHRARPRRLRPLAWISIAAHVAALLAVLGAGAWRMDKLEAADPPLAIASLAFPLPSAGGDEQPAAKPRKPPGKHPAFGQPTRQRIDRDEAPEPSNGGGDKGPAPGIDLLQGCAPGAVCQPGLLDGVKDPVCGNGQVEAGEQCDDGGRAGGDGCSSSCKREVTIVRAKMIEGQRISGDPQIQPPDEVRVQMFDKGQKQAVGTIYMCLARDGSVASLTVMQSTGYQAYDERLTARMREWRYRPYRLADGNAVPVCTEEIFVYRVNLGAR
ncbi:MAG TPA: hypothetical protein VKB80_02580 [Kofleriaceae bacterium]|nr:hypothetical protein [Kofleriaceae bacterium]